MEHRLIKNNSVLSAATIDGMIDRGGCADWATLRGRAWGNCLMMGTLLYAWK